MKRNLILALTLTITIAAGAFECTGAVSDQGT